MGKCNKAGAVFDTTKLEWMNAQYVRATPADQMVAEIKPVITEMFGEFEDDYIVQVFDLIKERIHFLRDMPNFADYMFKNEIEIEEAYVQKRWKDDSEQIARDLFERFQKDEEFSHDSLKTIAKAYAEEKEIKLGPITHPLRIMTTGKSVGAGIFETLEILGKERCIKRMGDYLAKI